MMHRLMREGNGEAVMGFLGSNAGLLNMSGYHDNSSGGQGMYA